MTDPTTVLPGESGPALLRVHSTSRLAFGATTAALVTLASGGTAVLVAHGTSSLSGPTALPSGQLLPGTPSAAPGSVVVDRAPGSYVQPVQVPRQVAPPAVDETADALRKALADRPPTGKRTLTAPLVELPRAQVPDVPPVVEVPDAPVVTPPVVTPPVVTPPVVPEVPVHTPRVPTRPSEKPSYTGHDEGHHDRADKKADKDKNAVKKAHDAGKAAEAHPERAKHARSGRHAR